MMIKGMAQLPYQAELMRLEAECDEMRWALQSSSVWEAAILERKVERAKLKLAIVKDVEDNNVEEDEEDKEDDDRLQHIKQAQYESNAAPDPRNRHSSPLGVHRIDAFRSLPGRVEK